MHPVGNRVISATPLPHVRSSHRLTCPARLVLSTPVAGLPDLGGALRELAASLPGDLAQLAGTPTPREGVSRVLDA